LTTDSKADSDPDFTYSANCFQSSISYKNMDKRSKTGQIFLTATAR
jgi:hypothetical protein